jgi:hypothetical protein
MTKRAWILGGVLIALTPFLVAQVGGEGWGILETGFFDGDGVPVGPITTVPDDDLVLDPGGTGTVDIRSLVQIGDGTYSPGHSPTSIHAEGISEFDDIVYIDSRIDLAAGAYIYFYGAEGGAFKYHADDGLHWVVYGLAADRQNRNIIITDWPNRGVDHDHDTLSTHPTLWIHSSTNPDEDNTSWGNLRFEGTSGNPDALKIETGSGDIDLIPAGGNVNVTGQIHATAHDYGEMYIDADTDVGIDAQNVWFEVDGFQEGLSESVTFADSDLTVARSGIYECHYSVSATGGVNKSYEYSLSIDDAIQGKCSSGRKYAAADLGSNGGHCLLNITAAGVIKLEIRNITDGSDITIRFSNVHIHQLE